MLHDKWRNDKYQVYCLYIISESKLPKIEKFLIFDLEFYWIIRDKLFLNVLDIFAYLYKGGQIREQSVRKLEFIKQLEYIALYLDLRTSVKSMKLYFNRNSISLKINRYTSGNGK